jgi:hypothetical protein
MILQWKGLHFCAVVAIGAFVLSGCQGMTDTQRTQAEGTAGGAAIGALLGGVLGGGKGAAFGAAAGGLSGLIAGVMVAQHKNQYATAENFYDTQIDQTRARNMQLASYNNDLNLQVGYYRQQIAMLETAVQTGNANLQSASDVQRQVAAKYAESSKMLEASEQDLEQQNEVVSALRRSAGDQAAVTRRETQEVAMLSDHVRVLQGQVQTLASQSSQLEQFR